MATSIPPTSVWQAMSYTPPRGKCNFKSGLMSGTCPCLRFMLHPVKASLSNTYPEHTHHSFSFLLHAATSFECDGCAHHASYHLMENPDEDAILQRWAQRENQETALVPLGRRRANGAGGSDGSSAGTGTKRRRVANGAT
ncbi:Hypothetical protein D9617_17g047160 [Elsinoe fawcettii]|nr:Hypothetical protein D9617_17g047160 [Elsinoe fawcettii]